MANREPPALDKKYQNTPTLLRYIREIIFPVNKISSAIESICQAPDLGLGKLRKSSYVDLKQRRIIRDYLCKKKYTFHDLEPEPKAEGDSAPVSRLFQGEPEDVHIVFNPEQPPRQIVETPATEDAPDVNLKTRKRDIDNLTTRLLDEIESGEAGYISATELIRTYHVPARYIGKMTLHPKLIKYDIEEALRVLYTLHDQQKAANRKTPTKPA